MATLRQKRIAKALIENSKAEKPLSAGALLRQEGYSDSMSLRPGAIIESEGVKEALAEFGFTVENAKKVVGSILSDEKQDSNARLKASDIVFKVHGEYASDKKPTQIQNNVNFFIDGVSENVRVFEKQLKEKMGYVSEN